jgi:hypothetical protein
LQANWKSGAKFVDPAKIDDKWSVLVMADDLKQINRQSIEFVVLP